MNKPRILIAEDEKETASHLQILLKDQGQIDLAYNGDEAWRKFQQAQYDLVITDLEMPGMGGMELLGLIHKKNPEIPIIVITAHGTINSAVQAMKTGVYDYITKPYEKEGIKITVSKALAFCHLKDENRNFREAIGAKYSFKKFIGNSPQIKILKEQAVQVAQTSSTVLIQAESGTGKELLVGIIHFNSSRSGRPFVAFNCGAIQDNLVEDELFGHEKGAFTNAQSLKLGRFERAHTGTIFLDEVGDLSLEAQKKILRVLEEKTFERVGGKHSIQVDVRIIAATNKDLKKLVEEGTFREDLYFRLNVFFLSIPPLRERKEDIQLLTKHFLDYFSEEMGKQVTKVSDEAMKLLLKHSWKGNVRELKNHIERAMILCRGDIITAEDLQLANESSGPCPAPDKITPYDIDIPEEGFSLDEMEKVLIIKTIIKAGGNQTKAAKLLSITRNTLRYRVEKHNISLNDLNLND